MDSVNEHFTYPWIANSTVHVQLDESKAKIEKTQINQTLIQGEFSPLHLWTEVSVETGCPFHDQMLK